jgi:hypothetical protein
LQGYLGLRHQDQTLGLIIKAMNYAPFPGMLSLHLKHLGKKLPAPVQEAWFMPGSGGIFL